jgi:hypothetical protein
MAFENLNTNQFKTYLTKIGLRKLLQPGNNFNIKYFSLSDKGINYNVDVDNDVVVTSVTGDPLKTLHNGSSNLRTLFEDSRITVDNISKRELVFVRECDNLEFRNATININVGNYLDYLKSAQSDINNLPNDFNSILNVYDYVKVYEYTENAFNELKLWDTKNDNIVYDFVSESDYKNYKILTNTFVEKTTTSVKVNYDSNRFKSPFMLTFASLRSETGIITQNGQFSFEAYPVETFGYLVDGAFIQPQFLSESQYSNAKNVTPAVNFLGITHKIDEDPNRVYKPEVNNVLFRFPKLINTTISASKNLFEFYGSDTPNNEKLLKIDFNVNIGGDTKLSRPAKLTMNFILDMNESNWDKDNDILTITL